jgi:hypothetical protein
VRLRLQAKSTARMGTPSHNRAHSENGWRPPLWSYLLALAIVLTAVYLPDVGRGFVKDDFGWILASRVREANDLIRVFLTTTGFFRPLVSLTFAANEWLFGVNPLGYGLTNFALLLACAAAVAWLARAHELSVAASLFAGAIWALNFHGINMAVLWISGRTALLLTLWAVLAAVAARKGHPATAAILAFVAMLSKEEAVLLPLPLLVIMGFASAHRPTLIRGSIYFAVVEALYFLLRHRSDAMTPMNAPEVYRFTFGPGAVLGNIVQYADRSSTLVAIVLLILLVLAWRIPTLSQSETRVASIGLVWILAGFAITIFLPVRSSLYACFPSVGSALAGAALASAVWRALPESRRTSVAVAALMLPLLLIPVYKARNRRWVELADLSNAVAPALRSASRAAENDRILIVDDQSTRVNLAAALGSISEATAVLSDDRRTVWLVRWRNERTNAGTVVEPGQFRSAWVLRNGRLIEEEATPWIGSRAEVIH